MGPRIKRKKSGYITSSEGKTKANEERERPERTEGRGKEREGRREKQQLQQPITYRAGPSGGAVR